MKPYQAILVVLALVLVVVFALHLIPGAQVILEQLSTSLGSLASWLSGILGFAIGVIVYLVVLAAVLLPIVCSFGIRSLVVAGLDKYWDEANYVQTGWHIIFSFLTGILMAILEIWIIVRITTDNDAVGKTFAFLRAPKWDFFEHVPVGWALAAFAVGMIVYALSPGLRDLKEM
jgi:succinate dehydrogenase hydrophobic anchor subunit